MPLTRRGLLLSGLAAGGGLGLAVLAQRLDDGDAVARFGASTPGATPLNAWLKIAADGTVICGIHRAELGQGVTTSLPMLLAEELDADWTTIRWEFTPVDKDYFNFGLLLRGEPLGPTEGRFWPGVGTAVIREVFHQLGLGVTISSSSTVDAWDTLRLAGAQARDLLIRAAARRWEVDASRLVTVPGRVRDPDTGLESTYGELASLAALEKPREVALRSAAFRLIGTSPPRLDVPAKVTGAARFGIDTRVPGMLFGAVRHAPRVGARLGHFDSGPALTLPGVDRVVPLGNQALAVLARDTWTAEQAADRLVLGTDVGGASLTSAALMADYRAALDSPTPSVFRDEGDVAALLAGGAVQEAVYELPFLAHVCMEPMNCAAQFVDGRLTVWAPTQALSMARDEAAKAARMDPERVDVHQTLAGGGFGRRAEMDYVVQATLAAMAVPGRPVLLTWSRSEDIRHDMLRPAAVGRVRGVLRDGRIAGLDYTLVSESVVSSNNRRTPSPRGGDAAKDKSALSGAMGLQYVVPALRFAYVPRDDGVPVGFWRSVSNSINPFLLECFVDELAVAAGVDPLEFRHRHLPAESKARSVLDAAANLAGWSTPRAPGKGRGIAFTESHGTAVAHVVEVTVASDGALTVDRISCAADCGTVVHPDNVVAQFNGCIVDGMAAALDGRITLKEGVVEQGNFDDYPWPRLAQMPEIAVRLLPGSGRPGGVGEPGLPGVAPALANAIFHATGKRLRTLPLGRRIG
jgi:isoquinoline 1-oxidoreductase subunit beta